ncbi:hypothetical protein GO986_16300 [Deinococcus sp. HMF7620]|uniref:Uncharacterized protein n=1 Tax=Deinococcus arboris TaxID=2682977 RepID=A0A7C9I0M9_9DEIO|nr:hypothetical protein [Deinococcus arboris]MVN88308.1 hypothetical protein [Deinococcus arboris]
MTYSIEIADFNSSNIRQIAEQVGVTHMREIGSGYARGIDENGEATIDNTGNSEAQITAYEFSNGTRVINTNGDPVWEDEDAEVFAELAASADIEL